MAKLGDFITVPSVDGGTIDIPRGNMNDQEWQQVVASADGGISAVPDLSGLADDLGLSDPAAALGGALDAGISQPPGLTAPGNDPLPVQSANQSHVIRDGARVAKEAVKMAAEAVAPAINPAAGLVPAAKILSQPIKPLPTRAELAAQMDGGVSIPDGGVLMPQGAPALPTDIEVKEPPAPTATVTQSTTSPDGVTNSTTTTHTKTPGSATAPSGFRDAYRQAQEINDAAYQAEKSAIMLQGDLESQKLAENARLREQHVADEVKFEAQRKQLDLGRQQIMDQGARAYQDIINQQQALVNQGVNPNRYWADQNIGQKIAAVIAAAGFGFTGKGIDYIKHLDSLVERDIAIQQNQLNRQGSLLNQMASNTQNIIQMGRQRGLDDMASLSAARAARYEQLQSQIAVNADKIGTEAAKARSSELIAALEQKKAKSIADMAKEQEGLAINWYNAETQRMNAAAQLEFAAQRWRNSGVGGLSAEERKQASNILAIENQLDRDLKRAEELVKKHGSNIMLGSAANEYKSLRNNIAVNMAKLLDPTSVARESEVERESKALGLDNSLLTFDSTAIETIELARKRIKDYGDIRRGSLGLPPNWSRGQSGAVTQVPRDATTPWVPPSYAKPKGE